MYGGRGCLFLSFGVFGCSKVSRCKGWILSEISSKKKFDFVYDSGWVTEAFSLFSKMTLKDQKKMLNFVSEIEMELKIKIAEYSEEVKASHDYTASHKKLNHTVDAYKKIQVFLEGFQKQHLASEAKLHEIAPEARLVIKNNM